MIKINSIQDLEDNKALIPESVMTDVKKRIEDWMSYEGSKLSDDYVTNNFRYVKRVIEIANSNGGL